MKTLKSHQQTLNSYTTGNIESVGAILWRFFKENAAGDDLQFGGVIFETFQ